MSRSARFAWRGILGALLPVGVGLFLATPSLAQTASDRLADLVNGYRVARGLPAITVSVALTRVAQDHVRDLESSRPSGTCNAHSWSPGGDWTPCCYTTDQTRAQCMWDKPREITRGAYAGNGYEIAYETSGRVTPEAALEGWKASSGHIGVVLNRGIWSSAHWRSMGVAVSTHYAVVWFGEE